MIAIRVISGVTALIIPANTEVTLVSANAKRTPGMTLSNSATTHKCIQILLSVGSETLRDLAMINSAIAPREVRPKATPTGVRNSRPNLMKMKEHPHTVPSAI